MKTQTLFFTLFFICIFHQIKAQDRFHIRTGPNGDITVRGQILGEILFDTGDLVGDYINYRGAVFLVQYDPQGNIKWVKNFLGSEANLWDFGKLEIDNSNNIYITGAFNDSIAFDSMNYLVSTSTQRPDPHIKGFLAKLDPQGNFIRGFTPDIANNSNFIDIEIDSQDNIYILGSYTGAGISFGEMPPLMSTGPSDKNFIAKFNAEGKGIWLRSLNMYTKDASTFSIIDFEIDEDENVYFTGNFRGNKIDNLTYGNLGLTGNKLFYEIFIAKGDKLGNALWLKKVKTEGGSDNPIQLKLTVEGDIYLAGHFIYSSTFGNLPSISNNYGDSFIAQYDPSGNAQWVRQVSPDSINPGSYEEIAIALSPSANIFSVGRFFSSMKFPPLAPIASDTGSIFLAKLDNVGNGLCATNTRKDLLDLSVDDQSNVYTVTFRGWKYNGPSPIFAVSKWGDNCNLLWENYANVYIIGSNKDPLPQTFAKTYPNPAINSLNIELAEMLTSAARLELHDISGKLILKEELTVGTQNKKLDISNQPNGLYLLRIITEEGTLNRKIMKM